MYNRLKILFLYLFFITITVLIVSYTLDKQPDRKVRVEIRLYNVDGTVEEDILTTSDDLEVDFK